MIKTNIAKRSAIIITLTFLTGCSQALSAISPSYKAGYEIGKEFGSYVNTDQIDTLNSWLPQSDQINVDTELNDKSIKELCTAMFDVSGLLAGLKNTDSNRRDFSDGCVTGFNEARNA